VGVVRFISKANPVGGSNAYQQNFQLCFITERCALSKTPGFSQISPAAFSTPCFNAS
jgi:hypothetical protein